MLIRFTVENFLSFNERVELSMIPGKTPHRHHFIKGEDMSLLKAGVIYRMQLKPSKSGSDALFEIGEESEGI